MTAILQRLKQVYLTDRNLPDTYRIITRITPADIAPEHNPDIGELCGWVGCIVRHHTEWNTQEEWFERGAKRGDQYSLGMLLYLKSRYNNPECGVYLKNASDTGHIPAMFSYGCYLMDGVGGDDKIVEAVLLFIKAAYENFKPAQKILASIYNSGLACIPSNPLLYKYYTEQYHL